MSNSILVAGATGNLGTRICTALIERGASVRALVRASANPGKTEALRQMGVTLLEADLNSTDSIAEVCTGVDCVVSALAGLGDVILEVQKNIVAGALQAGVPRFIPSDFCTDYTDLVPGENRNFDLRRAFRAYIDDTGLKVSSVFNGAFAEILTYNTPILNVKDQYIGYWGDKKDWKLDFTTMDDTAAFTAEVALDDNAPRDLHIASFQVSPADIQTIVTEIGSQPYTIRQLSSLEDFAHAIKKQRAANPAGEHELYAKWQQSQYLYSMFMTHHNHLDTSRYRNLGWTTAMEYLNSFITNHG